MDDESGKRPSLTIERCKITNTNTFASYVPEKKVVTLDIHDNNFTLANNFVSGNLQGGILVQLGRSDGTSLPRSLIYGNTFSSNANGTILLQQRIELKRNYGFVYITNNIFESNLGHGSTIKLTEVQSEIVNNFFYNNTGLRTIEYDFSSNWPKGQRCELNTLYLNKGLGQNISVTIMSNGPMKFHRNNLKNPANLYEFSSTRQAVTDPIDATLNWWGAEMNYSVSSRIHDKSDDYRLAAVEYTPFHKLPPRNILSSKLLQLGSVGVGVHWPKLVGASGTRARLWCPR